MRTWNLLVLSIFLTNIPCTVSALAQTQATPGAAQSKQLTKQDANKENRPTEQNAKGTTTGTSHATGTADKTKQSTGQSKPKRTTTGAGKTTTAGGAKTTTAGGAKTSTAAGARGPARTATTAKDTGNQPTGKPIPKGTEKPGADASTQGAAPQTPPRRD